jgi:hypothetical protein
VVSLREFESFDSLNSPLKCPAAIHANACALGLGGDGGIGEQSPRALEKEECFLPRVSSTTTQGGGPGQDPTPHPHPHISLPIPEPQEHTHCDQLTPCERVQASRVGNEPCTCVIQWTPL